MIWGMGMRKKLWGLVVVAAPLLAGCAGVFQDDQAPYSAMPREPGKSLVENSGQKPLQCVPFARDHSQIKIFGDAYTWWDQAAEKYQRSAMPQSGSVMVLSGYAGPERGHVAVVQKIISAREIRVDHANWLDDGSIYLNDPVVDVSPDNDWSAVRVFNIQTGAWGGNVYPVKGFILPNQGGGGSSGLIARADISEIEQ
jgi:surface antigen